MNDEINELKTKIDPPLWDAIDAVREVGNIGAHMQKDVSVIVNVAPGEAQQLIELVEVLFEDFYVARHQREQRVKRAAALGERKKSEKGTSAPAAPVGDRASAES